MTGLLYAVLAIICTVLFVYALGKDILNPRRVWVFLGVPSFFLACIFAYSASTHLG